jgi:transcriptional regulator with XRE-family HTH domain
MERMTSMIDTDKRFFEALGLRVAQVRKNHNLTQVQLGELLGISQQMVASYEVGRRRIPLSLLPRLAQGLAVPVEVLLGTDTSPPTKRGPAPKLQQQLERLSRLPRAKQRLVSEMLEAVLQQASR